MNDNAKRIIRFFLLEDWTEVFGSYDKERKIKLMTEDYVTCFEILAEANDIPHGFDRLLSSIFHDSEEQGFKNMWNEECKERTARALQAIMIKALRNPYVKDSEPYVAIENALLILRQQQTDYTDYEQAKAFYKKIESLTRVYKAQNHNEMRELIDSWYD